MPTPPDRPAPPAVADAPRPDGRRRAFLVTGIVVLVILAIVSLALVFRSGAYAPGDWLPFVIGVGALALMIIISAPSVTADPMQRLVLGIFAALAVWTALSIFWTSSLGDTWEEINRTLFYAVTIALTFAAVRWSGPLGLKVLAGLVTAVVTLTALVILVQLATNDDAISLLPSGRLNYPITYWNGLACFLVVGFWLAMGLANGMGGRPSRRSPARRGSGAPQEPAANALSARAEGVPQGPDGTAPAADATIDLDAAQPQAEPKRPNPVRAGLARATQPLLLMVAVFLLEFALLPQSRGGLWTFFLVIPFFVVLSPNRFRALVDLIIVAVPVVLFWGRITGVYTAIHESQPLAPALTSALHGVGYSVLFVLVAWAVTYVVERLLAPHSSRRSTMLVGAILIVAAIGLMVAGLVYADHRTGGLNSYVGDRWDEFVGDTVGGTPDDSNRFAAFGLNGRLTQWKVAAEAFQQHPLLGIGAQNFELYHYLHRVVIMDVRQPHSQPMQLLAELGIPGLVLYVAFVLIALVRGVVLRFRARSRADMAVIAAIMTGCLGWFIHSSADWLWQLAGLTLPVMMLFAGLIAAGGPWWGDARAEALAARSAKPVDPLAFLDADPAAASPRRADLLAAKRASKRRLRWSPRYTAWIATVLILAVIASAAFPYLSLRFSTMAAGETDLATVDARTHTAALARPDGRASVRGACHRLHPRRSATARELQRARQRSAVGRQRLGRRRNTRAGGLAQRLHGRQRPRRRARRRARRRHDLRRRLPG